MLAWAAWEIAKIDPAAVIVSLHADHIIKPKAAFLQLLRDAAGLARETGSLFTVSVLPSRPETGYGYIEPGDPLLAPEGVRAFAVGAFHEKPDIETAHRYIDEGHFWNSGIFVWTASAFLSEVRKVAPEIGDLLPLIDDESPEAFFRPGSQRHGRRRGAGAEPTRGVGRGHIRLGRRGKLGGPYAEPRGRSRTGTWSWVPATS